ncbi:MAG: cytochrome b562 [Sodalis sp. (in: enterobacteria)]
MRRFFLALLPLLAVLFATSATAWELSEDMDMIAANYSALLHTDNPATLKQALAEDMHAAAADTRDAPPPKLRGQAPESPQMQDYRRGIDTLLGQIKQAQVKVEKGYIEGARQARASSSRPVMRTTPSFAKLGPSRYPRFC